MISRVIAFAEKKFTWTNIYGVSRTLLATGTLLTLLTNRTTILFKNPNQNSFPCDPLEIGVYCLVGDLEIARWISVALLIVVASGWRPVITGLLHWWVTYSLANSATIIDGGDHIASIITLLLIPVTLTDTRKWHWSIADSSTLRSQWYTLRALTALSGLLVIKLQVAVIYLNSAAAKLSITEWTDGTAVYYWFKHPLFGYPNWLNNLLEPLILNGVSVFIISWGTIIFEFILFAGLFMDQRFKRIVLILAIIFHFGIFIVHGLASFFFTMTASVILYLSPVEKNLIYNRSAVSFKSSVYDISNYFRRSFIGNRIDT